MASARPRSMPLSSVDTAWLRMETRTNLMMITSVLTFDAPLDFERLKKTLEYRMLGYDRFTMRVVDPKTPRQPPRWEPDPNFNINNHLSRFRLPPPGDKDMLQKLTGHLMSTPLDYEKPLWEWHYIEGYGKGSAIVTRLHHSIADGIALVSVMLSMLDQSADAPWPTPDDFVSNQSSRPRRSGNPLNNFLKPARRAMRLAGKMSDAVRHEVSEVFANPGHALDLAKLGLSGAGALGKLALMPPDPKTIYKGKLGRDKAAAWSRKIPLEQVKAVGKTLGGTVNDVLLTAVAGALARYLEYRGEPTEGLDLRAVIPVNLRPIEARPKQLGNQFGLVFLALPVGVEDPYERLLILKRRMDEIKNSPEAVVAFGILGAIGTAPTEIENVVVEIFGAKATAVMTNVPGPREPLFLAGQEVKDVMFWVPQSGRLGLGVSILSYNGSVTLGIASDSGMVPRPDDLVDAFDAEFEALLALVPAEQQPAPVEAQAPKRARRPKATGDGLVDPAVQVETQPKKRASGRKKTAPHPDPESPSEETTTAEAS